MKKSLKHNLTIAAVSIMMAVPVFSATQSVLPSRTVTVHANNNSQYDPGKSLPKPFANKWEHVPGVWMDQYNSSFNKAVGGSGANMKDGPVTKTINGHTVVIDPESQTAGKVVSVDGKPVTSRAQIEAMLRKSASTKTAATTKSNSDESNKPSSSSSAEYQNSKTNHGKLVQTGEKKTAITVGIVVIVLALAAFVIAKVRKVAKNK